MSDNSNTIPGGYYIGTDGKPHDAHGNPIPERKAVAVEPEPVMAAPEPEPEPEPKPSTKKAK